jgi:hypothetical protein
MITWNARWNGTQWVEDNSGAVHARYDFASTDFRIKNYTGASPWADSSWVSRLDYSVNSTTNVVTAVNGEFTGDGVQVSYGGVEGFSNGTNNLGAGTNYRRKFNTTPSSYTWTVILSGNVAAGPVAYSNSTAGTGFFIQPTTVGQTYWYGTVSVS